MKKFFGFLSAAAILTSAFSCSKPDEKTAVSEIQLSESSATLYIDETNPDGSEEYPTTIQLSATVLPENASDKSIIWASDNPLVVFVSKTGLATAIDYGTANISATSADKKQSASCVITVKRVPVRVTSVSISSTEESVSIGNSITLVATALPENADNRSIKWSSSDESVASVSQEGVVTGKAFGNVTITATSEDKPEITASCTVHVVTPATGIELEESQLALEIGGVSTAQLHAKVLPETAPIQSINWSSTNEGVATVSETGLVTAVGNGTATITATSVDGGFQASCTVSVSTKVTGISVDKGYVSLVEGKSIVLKASVLPATASNQAFSWSIENEAIATIGADGTVSAIAAGTTKATVTSEEGGFKAEVIILVKKEGSSDTEPFLPGN